jgi:hypothetical protein
LSPLNRTAGSIDGNHDKAAERTKEFYRRCRTDWESLIIYLIKIIVKIL